jgi:hypothetical protein
LDGWRNRQFVADNGKAVGLDHSGLYSRGRLIHGRSIHDDAPGTRAVASDSQADKLLRGSELWAARETPTEELRGAQTGGHHRACDART